MREYIDELKKWQSSETIAMARVIKTWGSSPRPVGSLMFVNGEGKMIGSVSGGCVEGAVVKSARQVIEQKEAKRLSFGVSDEEAWSVGLSCGGSIQVFLQPISFGEQQLWQQLQETQGKNHSSILISSLVDGKNRNTLIEEDGNTLGDEMPATVTAEAREAYKQRANRTVTVDGNDYFIQIFPRKSILLAIGAAHITVDLVDLANSFGFQTIVIDPRGYFTQNMVFKSQPDQIHEAYLSEVLNNFPLDAYTFCAILSHDPKIDDNALEILLPSEVGYIGALGSKKTHAKRTQRLLDKGISQETIDRIKAPIGVSIHAKSAQEIALSIMSQIIEAKNQFVN